MPHFQNCHKIISRRILCILLFASLMLSLLNFTSSSKEIVYRATINNKKQIALTFDDGPHPVRTPEILDILDKYGIKATFFLIGQNIEYYPEIITREIQSGHEIGNHTYSHARLDKMTCTEIENEINKFESALSKYYDYCPSLIRPPCGYFGNSFKSTIEDLNYKIILWSIDTRDWSHTPADKIIDDILSKAKSGDIILMHDYITGTSPTPTVLEAIIPKLINEGYEFVTVSELLS